MNQETKNCQNCKQDFIIEPEDFNFYEKMKVPAPTWCPECRARRRFSWRGESVLFKRKSDFSDKVIFSGFSPKSFVRVYESEAYYSDKWDSLEFGQEFDFSRLFFEQFFELLKKVPLPAIAAVRPVDSDYCNWITDVKNGYLVFNTTIAEDCAYGNAVNRSRNCVDNSHLDKSELCYEGFWLLQCNRAYFSSQSAQCTDIYFSKNLLGCSDCFGCVNLRNKKYHIFNQPYSKEEYFKKIKEFKLDSYESLQKLKQEADHFFLKFPNKFIEGIKNDDVSGEYISRSKNVHDSYLITEGENLRYCQYLTTPPNKDCYDHTVFGNNNELTYECTICGLGMANSKFCWCCWGDVRNLTYSIFCNSSADLFGCVSVRKKQYCILNKQYTKEAYEVLVSKIIEYMKKTGEYGEFFPSSMSPFAYNETIAQEHWPLTKEKAGELGYSWRDVDERNYKVTMTANDLPDNAKEIPDSITDEVIGCAHKSACEHQCTGAFKIISQELQFYQKMNLPLPRLCPNCRRSERLSRRHSMKFFDRKCMCAGAKSENSVYQNSVEHFHNDSHCPNEFETSYAPERPEIVYCEQCYQAEVV